MGPQYNCYCLPTRLVKILQSKSANKKKTVLKQKRKNPIEYLIVIHNYLLSYMYTNPLLNTVADKEKEGRGALL